MVDTDDTRRTTDVGRRTTDDGRRTTPRVWHKLPTGELKMYNKSKLTVTVKCLIGAKGVQTSLMLQLSISVSGHLMLSAF